MTTSNTCIIIPARLGSQRLTQKPLQCIGTQPMIEHVWRRALKANLGPVWVAADDLQIVNHIKKLGGQALLTPQDLSSGTDRVICALQQLDPEHQWDRVVNLQGDMPNIDPQHIRLAASAFDTPGAERYDVSTLVHDASEEEARNPSLVKVAYTPDPTRMGPALYFSRHPIPYQHLSKPRYFGHIGLYVFRRPVLDALIDSSPAYLEKLEKLEQLRWLQDGKRILAVEVDAPPISVDTPEDLAYARKTMDQGQDS